MLKSEAVRLDGTCLGIEVQEPQDGAVGAAAPDRDLDLLSVRQHDPSQPLPCQKSAVWI